MTSINRRLRDFMIAHIVDVRGYTANVVRRMIATLNRSDDKLFTELMKTLERMDPERFSVVRLDRMLESVRTVNADAWAALDSSLRSELKDFTSFEVAFAQGALETVTGAMAFPVARVSVEQVYAAALSRPFQGGLLKEFLKDIEDKRATAIRRAVADGFVQNKTTDQIVRDVRGTAVNKYSDGIIEISRRDAQAVVRTALSHTAAFAQQEVWDANEDLIKGYQWVATLDTRTTPQCQIRDGKEYDRNFKPVGHNLPWGAGPGLLHWNCRSTRAPITKSWRELGIDADEVPASTRASMDGQVPDKLTYEEWLATQSEERQIEVLGPTRAKLFREGGLDLKDLYNAQGEEITLDELRKRQARAFETAGL
jgi:SPP1 gp7 family putative phage head morphogenesis protein